MSENTPEVIKNIEPPEVILTAPKLSETPEISETPETEKIWLVVAKNRRVNRDWEALMQRQE